MTDLAILLVHELSHLVLSHHLETLSLMAICVPGVLSLISGFICAFVFPITMLFGPFANDAFADMGKARSGEFLSVLNSQFTDDIIMHLRRLLTHAGFNPVGLVQFWEDHADGFQGSTSGELLLLGDVYAMHDTSTVLVQNTRCSSSSHSTLNPPSILPRQYSMLQPCKLATAP